MQCLRCQQENRLNAKFCDGCGTPLQHSSGGAQPTPSYADVQRYLAEALERETATSDILQIISGSPTDVQPVFNTIASTAARLCDAFDAAIHLVEGEVLRLVAHKGPIAPDAVVPVTQATLGGYVVRARQATQVADMHAAEAVYPASSEFARRRGFRTILCVPLLRSAEAIGTITIRRTEVRAFTDRQITLLKTFADQAVIAIENVRLFKELEARNRDLTTALDRQTATGEVLRVIAAAQTDVQPVFDTIAANALSLCAASYCAVFRYDGELIHVAAVQNINPEGTESLRLAYPAPPSRGNAAARAILTRDVVDIPDVCEDADYQLQTMAAAVGFRSVLCVPMLREGSPIGAISVTGADVAAFSANQVELLKMFADQAVIAIENVRLFKELEGRNRDLTEALEQQTATAEILRVISSSPTDVQPVFDALAESAAGLCESFDSTIWRQEGDRLRLVAHHGGIPQTGSESFLPLVRGTVGGRSVLDGRTVHIADTQSEGDEFPESSEFAQRQGYRTILSVPLMREGVAIGAIVLRRTEARLFTERQVALLQTFADQAVIAIENVRLFKELEARNHDLTEALDRQTATAEILRVISQSHTDTQPVFDTIIRSAVRLLDGFSGVVTRLVGDQLHLAALTSTNPSGDAAQTALWPKRVQEDTFLHGQVIVARAPRFIADVESDPAVPQTEVAVAKARGYRSIVAVPLIRDGRAVGSMAVTRVVPGVFADGQIAVLRTFADQAAIAIENVRLFTELQARTQELTRSVDELTALGEVSRALSSTLDLETVLQTIVTRAVQLSAADAGTILEYDESAEVFHPRVSTEQEAVVTALRGAGLRKGEGAVGRMAVTHEPVQISDISIEGAYESRVREALLQSGRRAVLALPLLREDHIIGGLVMSRNSTGEFSVEVIDLLKTFATQSALAVQNARLFREIEAKSRQLEVASQHKSEFLANMSHELRTPLNAIIGFSEVLGDHMFGELNEKQEEYLKDINASGGHLLSLINDILDLSKIEAGRMELELTDFDLPTALDNALMLVRERAQRRSLALHKDVDAGVGQIRGDERKIRQVVLNLLSNAIKFTPEGGRIEVGAVAKDGLVEVSVSDTGVGIALEDQEKVFEEFRQVGMADKKAEGTGLGLTLCRKFIELHGGRIWVKSQVGVGSTFTFTIPIRRGE